MRPPKQKALCIWGGLLILWMGAIFAFSHMPSPTPYPDPPFTYVLERKSAHVFEYAVLMFLAANFFRRLFLRESYARIVALAAIFSLAYAGSDELHQFFVPGRGAHLTDVGVDALGIIALGIGMLWQHRRRK